MPEPALPVDEIQGNILSGFNKDFTTLLLLKIRPQAADLANAKHWLHDVLLPQIAKTREVHAFNRDFRLAIRNGTTPPTATWVNVAFSALGIARLRSQSEVDQLGDEAFRFGLAKRSAFIGDPTNPTAMGNTRNWLYGGRDDNTPDILVIVASDSRADCAARVDTLVSGLDAAGIDALLPPQRGETLPPPWTGHEHFGFKDGISQPGVFGVGPGGATDFITPRYIDSSDPRSSAFGKPGQPLLWPGEFVLGQFRQFQVAPDPNVDTEADPLVAVDIPLPNGQAPALSPIQPAWALNGSYLVLRRLRQDFSAFWSFMRAQAAREGTDPDTFSAKLVGRWKSGAPIMRTPTVDDTALARDDLANNHFAFSSDSRLITAFTSEAPSGYVDSAPQARGDFLGSVCPHFAHIRKVNPRDEATDLGVAQDTGIRAIMRRGIPYGESLLGVANPTPEQLAADRGLLFISYQASIVDQFETLLRRWSNRPNLPHPSGHDPVIGQAHDHNGSRRRFIDLPSGRRCFIDAEWVIPTGGGYFFAPSITAIRDTLSQ